MGAGEYGESITTRVEGCCCRCWAQQERLLDDCIRGNHHIGVASGHYPRFLVWRERRDMPSDVCDCRYLGGRFPMERWEAVDE